MEEYILLVTVLVPSSPWKLNNLLCRLSVNLHKSGFNNISFGGTEWVPLRYVCVQEMARHEVQTALLAIIRVKKGMSRCPQWKTNTTENPHFYISVMIFNQRIMVTVRDPKP